MKYPLFDSSTTVFPILFLSSLCRGLLTTKSRKPHCPHNLFIDVQGWYENSRCVAIWEGNFTETYDGFNKLCNEYIPKATVANVLPRWGMLTARNDDSDQKHSTFLGIRITTGFCSKDVCVVLMADANGNTHSILYKGETLETLYSTKPGLTLPGNIGHLSLSYSGSRQYCLLLVGNIITAVLCSGRRLKVDRLICETDELEYCVMAGEKRNFSSRCLCKEPFAGPLCAGTESKEDHKEESATDGLDSALICYCAILVGITVFFVYVICRIKKQKCTKLADFQARVMEMIRAEEIREMKQPDSPFELHERRNPASPTATPSFSANS